MKNNPKDAVDAPVAAEEAPSVEKHSALGSSIAHAPEAIRADYELALRRLEHEHDLENNRLNWFLAFQGFLFASIAVRASQGNPYLSAAFYKVVVPLTGALVASLAWCGAYASQCARTAIKRWYYEKHGNDDLPRLSPSDVGSKFGRSAALSLPVILVLAWTTVLVTTEMNGFSPRTALEMAHETNSPVSTVPAPPVNLPRMVTPALTPAKEPGTSIRPSND